ncbi:tRNA-guanine transglycosylase DpdA [Bacillus sp. V59.32b]|uniref:tRNA-guanine transglycosylase DpdA n=1 Tax=Bacillus sp. V59.32b TaxID=1758642 RepID=UPI000E3CFDE4|nr:tRNA-guanine transglycosylase DpdA [Bacillus sp. V59.32b]RFU70002.1 peroxide stress protein YaaA [Bacillus sp. V59.32b]
MQKKVLVVTSCTGEKVHQPTNELQLNDFKDVSMLKKREEELASYKTTAGEMYTGKQHVALMEGVKKYRDHGGDIDVAILSAGYGMLRENDVIVPYEVTFNSMSGVEIKSWSKYISISQKLEKWIKDYDLIFFLLGDKYLQAIEWPLKTTEGQKLFFFAGDASKHKVLIAPNHYVIAARELEAKIFRSGLIELKGFLFNKLLSYGIENNNMWESIAEYPERIREYLLSFYKLGQQISMFEDEELESKLLSFYTIAVPYEKLARNYGSEFMFYIPENDDRVDPRYDFIEDYSDPQRDRLVDDVYAHELHHQPQYDGILISKVNVDKATKKKTSMIHEMGIREFLRLPDNYSIMGDCGAFSYIGKELPPYKTEEVLNYYRDLEFNYGVSVDHLIVGSFAKDEAERIRRYEITLNNAEDFITKYKQNKGEFRRKFTPIGVAQGWDPISFRNAVSDLVKMGYEYVALGGLAREKSYTIVEILKAIAPVIPNNNFRMHLFGVVRDNMEVMKTFHKLGATSFDSASPLRRAWLGSEHNYYGKNQHFSAIRIPEAKENTGRVKKLISEQGGAFSEYKALEMKALDSLRAFDRGDMDLDTTLEAILAYDERLGEKRERHADFYREVLKEKPWKQCGCNICTEIGIDVMIFRGNNRNRRRGFHNTHVFYEQVTNLKKEIKSELLVPNSY